MKHHPKKMTISLQGVLAYLRRQPKHFQHVYAFIFSGAITSLIASVILYVDYGFWHERYASEGTVEATSTEVVSESPKEMMFRFFEEAKEQLKAVDTSGRSFLEGTETYTKEPESSN